MILLIDNYDSFVFNLARYFQKFHLPTQVVRNDAITVDEIRALQPQAVVISPGPCAPQQAGISLSVVQQLSREFPLLGVCLGHQVIAEALGGEIVRSPEPVHGRTSPVYHRGEGVFAGLPSPFQANRYHSLMVDEQTLPKDLEVTARLADGLIMGLQHRELPTFGVQFHPESILTEQGFALLANFLQIAGVALPERLPSLADEFQQ